MVQLFTISSVRKRPTQQQIRKFVLNEVEKHPTDIVAHTADRFAISRQAAHRQVMNLTRQGLLTVEGQTRARRYKPSLLVEKSHTFPITDALEEDRVWSQFVRPELEGVRPNVLAICQYGLTEMVNNVRDHSEGTTCAVLVRRTSTAIEMEVADDGVGIFNKIQRELNLPDKKHALLELAKGKLTTDPVRHTGEGIFFTSRAFDRFSILSSGVFFHHNESGDWLVEDVEIEEEGTTSIMEIPVLSEKRLKEIFDRFALPDEFTFSRTKVPVKLAQYGDDNLVSRSQARRVLARFDQFKEVILDFRGVESIGQAFADEIFRVFKNAHPEIRLIWVRANKNVERMIRRAELTAGSESLV